MKVPFKWLNDYVDMDGITPQQLADRLNAVGVLVETVEERNQGITNVVVGHIDKLEPHPNADRLRVCQVDVGQPRPLQIVTGAPNVLQGNCVPVAVVGARLAGGKKIEKSKLRGLESEGMMCSADELGISIKDLPSEQREGVLIFPPDTPRGANVLELLGIDEVVLHLEPFANRPDSLSIIGIAREVSAALGRPLKMPPGDIDETDVSAKVDVKIEDRSLCNRYTARVIHDVKIGASPLWMAGRLQAAGMRSVNNVVDITNYVMLETGQPLHAFDLDKIEGASIAVRPARNGEKMTSIDGVERTLDERALVIADSGKPVAIAGVMGGLDSEVSDRTRHILLESASFNPASVRRTSTRLALRSESSRRFEKGLDWHGVDAASRRAAHLMQTLCGGKIAKGCPEDGEPAPAATRLTVRPARVNKVLGADIPPQRIDEILRSLYFQLDREGGGRVEVTVPSWRPDVRREEDLIEEVARHFGYDNIPARLPSGVTYPGRTNWIDREEENIRDILTALGLCEAITWSLLHPSKYDQVHWHSEPGVRVQNPLVADQSQLRTTLLPHLVEAVLHNLNARTEYVLLFEMSKIYVPTGPREIPRETRRLAIAVAGRKDDRALDFYYVRGILQALMRRLGIGAQIRAPQEAMCGFFHPGKSAVMYGFDKTSSGNGQASPAALATLGAMHPAALAALDTETEIVCAELDLDRVLELRRHLGWVQYRPISRFPGVQRDLALVVTDDVASGRIEDEVWAAAGKCLLDVRCFDVYRGPQIAEGHKSLAYSFTFQQPDRTLTDGEVEQLMQDIVKRVEQNLGARVRA